MLRDIVRGRVAVIILHGASIYEFESRIKEFEDLDVCYTSLGVFPMVEEFILSKVGKKLEIVLDCASVPEHLVKNYERVVRIPKLENFLSREESNCWITAHGHLRDLKAMGFEDFVNKYTSKTVVVDNIFPKEDRPSFMNVPNSATLLIASLMFAGASKIIILGMDGCKEVGKTLSSYFHPELIEQERSMAMDTKLDAGIVRDTDAFSLRFPNLYLDYKKVFNCSTRVLNCSPITVYDVIPKINYDTLKQELSTNN